MIFLTSNEPLVFIYENHNEKKIISIEIQKPKRSEQIRLWGSLLGEHFTNKFDEDILKIVNQFDLDESAD